MSNANDFFYNLPFMMERAGQAGNVGNIDTALTALIENQNKLLNYIADLRDRQEMMLNTIYEICPGLMVIEEITDDEERKRLLRKYMNTAVDSDNDDDVLDWVFMQENRHDE